ncbi:MAG: hypothetical protein JRD68_00215 [Deltaproteobacteria bacterium]|nr:hypothetical protein [Deltaproteobacteria bacterium]
MTELEPLEPEVIDWAVKQILTILEKGKMKVEREQIDPEFDERSLIIRQMKQAREKRRGQGVS